jgi:CO/xanthine dehydrogenase Mo-binding subunit
MTVDGGPAIISAIHDAVGVWVKELPVTPDKLWRGLTQRQEGTT